MPKREGTPLPTLPTAIASKWWQEKPAPPAVRPSQDWRSTRGRNLSRPVSRRAVLCRLFPELYLEHVRSGRTACPIRRPAPRLWPAPRIPSTCKSGQGAMCSMWTSIGGAIRRIQYTSGNQAPNAVIQATPLAGPLPLNVTFDGRASSDPNAGDTLTYSWDLNGDGTLR